MLKIVAGENFIAEKVLTQLNGNDLLVSSLTSAQAVLMQEGEAIKTWNYDGSTWDTGFSGSGNELKLQIDSEASGQLKKGVVYVWWRYVFPNAAFTVDGGKQIDRQPEAVAHVWA